MRFLSRLWAGVRGPWTAQWGQATHWLVYTLVGILVPPAVGGYLVLALGGSLSLTGFTSNGQFAIYSLSLWVTTHRLILRGVDTRIPGVPWLGPILLIGMLLSMALLIMGSLFSNGISVDTRFIEWPSVALFAFAIVATYAVVGLDSQRSGLDVRAQKREELSNLTEQFRDQGN